MEKKRKKGFKLFDMNRDGKGVDPGEDRTPNLKFFFKQFGRKFSKILSINLLMIPQVIPVLASILLYLFANPTTASQAHTEYAVLYGIQSLSSNAVSSINLSLFGYQLGLPTYNTYVYWVIGVLAVILVITYGWQKIGSTYVLRGLVRGDSVFVFSDYFYGIKKNLKQGFILGIIDCVIMGILALDIYMYVTSPSTIMNNIMYGMSIALVIMYMVIRFYVYLLIITFNISIFKAFKNSLIFIILGIKRNIMALLGIGIVTAIAVLLIVYLMPLGVGVVVILPFVYYLGVCGFIYTYAAYPVIQKYMIDPPQNNNTAEA